MPHVFSLVRRPPLNGHLFQKRNHPRLHGRVLHPRVAQGPRDGGAVQTQRFRDVVLRAPVPLESLPGPLLELVYVHDLLL
jgi:hypothetical protein